MEYHDNGQLRKKYNYNNGKIEGDMEFLGSMEGSDIDDEDTNDKN